MSRKQPFELQGHRGARGLRPENTLPSFEVCLDAGVSSIETDVRLSANGVPVLFHDDFLTERVCRVAPGTSAAMDFREEPFVSSFSLTELRSFLVDRNPDKLGFPAQVHDITPVAEAYATQAGMAPYAIPTLADLFAFTHSYAGDLGQKAGKTSVQRRRAARVRFDVELKRVPYLEQGIGDDYQGTGAGLLETKVIETVHAFKVLRRTRVRSFDHRSVRALKVIEPRLGAAVLLAGTALVSPAAAARLARAEIIAPDFQFVDLEVVQHAHARGMRIMPWTVNEARDWETLLAWGVDGITTDYPDRLADWLRKHHVEIK